MTDKYLPSPEMLRNLLRYEAETGRLFWKERPDHLFSSLRDALWWNARFAGHEAFTAVDGSGYLCGRIFGVQYRAHRVIWAIVNDVWPDCVDHQNGARGDNRISNLLSVTHAENMRNQRRPKNNTSGVVGVCRHKASGKWIAQIKVNFRNLHLGLFADFESAVAAREAAEVEHGFSKRHGRGA